MSGLEDLIIRGQCAFSYVLELPFIPEISAIVFYLGVSMLSTFSHPLVLAFCLPFLSLSVCSPLYFLLLWLLPTGIPSFFLRIRLELGVPLPPTRVSGFHEICSRCSAVC